MNNCISSCIQLKVAIQCSVSIALPPSPPSPPPSYISVIFTRSAEKWTIIEQIWNNYNHQGRLSCYYQIRQIISSFLFSRQIFLLPSRNSELTYSTVHCNALVSGYTLCDSQFKPCYIVYIDWCKSVKTCEPFHYLYAGLMDYRKNIKLYPGLFSELFKILRYFSK